MDNQEQQADLDTVVEESNEILVRFRGVWPIDLFPDEVEIDRHTITVRNRAFWNVEKKSVCHYDDLVNSEINLGPFFGSISIFSKYFTDNHERVRWLSRKDAKNLQAFLQGILIARKEGVDLKGLTRNEIIAKLYTIGKR